ncbi:MAG: 50S ribosomal protein L32 [Oscillospiraceae bacterium]|jgi:large subunit ribosomal protein L32|nr:50S ribosomal protein L32 [Oscillospiraceae bacterium]
MAIVPKRKTSKSRKNKRRSNVWKLEMPTLSRCEHCGEFHLRHRVCKNCGYYRGRAVLVKEEA